MRARRSGLSFADPEKPTKYHIDQNGLQPSDLITAIGSRNHVHEVLNRSRSRTLKITRQLQRGATNSRRVAYQNKGNGAASLNAKQPAARKPPALSSSTKTPAARRAGSSNWTGSAHSSLVWFSLCGNSTVNLLWLIMKSDAAKRCIAELGRKYLWWDPVGDQPHSENRIIAQAMNFGTFDDIVVLEQTVGEKRLAEVMLRPEPGWLSNSSWEFWRGRLSLAAGGAIPDEAPRRHVYAAAP